MGMGIGEASRPTLSEMPPLPGCLGERTTDTSSAVWCPRVGRVGTSFLLDGGLGRASKSSWAVLASARDQPTARPYFLWTRPACHRNSAGPPKTAPVGLTRRRSSSFRLSGQPTDLWRHHPPALRRRQRK